MIPFAVIVVKRERLRRTLCTIDQEECLDRLIPLFVAAPLVALLYWDAPMGLGVLGFGVLGIAVGVAVALLRRL